MAAIIILMGLARGWRVAVLLEVKRLEPRTFFGFSAVEDKVHVNDLHATMLGLMGLDHERLTYLFEGRDRRLTDVGGQNNLAERLLRA